MPRLPDKDSLGARPVVGNAYQPRNVTAVAEATTRLGQSISQAGEVGIDLYTKDDVARTQQAIAEYNDGMMGVLYDADSGLLYQKGANAQTLTSQTTAFSDTLANKLKAGLSENGRKAFDADVSLRGKAYLRTVADYQMGQMDAYNKQRDAAMLDSNGRSMVEALNSGDEALFSLSVQSSVDAVRAAAARNGAPPEAMALAITKGTEDAYTSAIRQATAAGDSNGALQLYARARRDGLFVGGSEELAGALGQAKEDYTVDTLINHYRSVPTTGAGFSVVDYVTAGESNGNINAVNPTSGAFGATQLLPSVGKQYGVTPKSSPQEIRDASEALARDNHRSFVKSMGREPSIDEQALMWQQGAKGAVDLLNAPRGALAKDIVGLRAVTSNGFNKNTPADVFAEGVMEYYRMANRRAGMQSNRVSVTDPIERQAQLNSVRNSTLPPQVKNRVLAGIQQTWSQDDALLNQQKAELQDKVFSFVANNDVSSAMFNQAMNQLKEVDPESAVRIQNALASEAKTDPLVYDNILASLETGDAQGARDKTMEAASRGMLSAADAKTLFGKSREAPPVDPRLSDTIKDLERTQGFDARGKPLKGEAFDAFSRVRDTVAIRLSEEIKSFKGRNNRAPDDKEYAALARTVTAKVVEGSKSPYDNRVSDWSLAGVGVGVVNWAAGATIMTPKQSVYAKAAAAQQEKVYKVVGATGTFSRNDLSNRVIADMLAGGTTPTVEAIEAEIERRMQAGEITERAQ